MKIVAFLLPFVFCQVFPQQPLNICQIPPDVLDESIFQFETSLLQIFPNFKLGCDGYLRSWAMISRVAAGAGLYLSVWRPSSPQRYQFIGESQIPPYNVTPNTWFEFVLREPFEVKADDVVGIYYGDWVDPWSHNGFIPVTTPLQQLPSVNEVFNGPVLLLKADRNQVAAETGGPGGYLNVTNADTVSRRLPAVIAFVDTAYVGPSLSPPNPGPAPVPVAGDASKCTAPIRLSADCQLNPNLRVNKYFFNVPIRECRQFWYFDPCISTLNLFESMAECEATCSQYIRTGFQ